jgi:hypothetical protein
MLLRSLALMIAAFAVAACGSDGDGNVDIAPTTPTSTPDVTLPSVIAAREDLAERFGLQLDEIGVVSVSAQEWSDSCLGVTYLGQEEECAEAIIPGYEMVLELDGGRYFYRTDDSGSIVRIAGLDLSPD